jgi:hypothetical protein
VVSHAPVRRGSPRLSAISTLGVAVRSSCQRDGPLWLERIQPEQYSGSVLGL